MPVALVTLHAYRSWTEDNPGGYVQRGESGIKPPDEALARRRAALAIHPPVRWDDAQKSFLLREARGIAEHRGWRVHAGSCTATHLHLIVSWREDQVEAKDVRRLRRSRLNFGGGREGDAIAESASPSLDEQVAIVIWKLKELLGMRLSQGAGSRGNRWFSRGEHDRWVRDEEHLHHLRSQYLPAHVDEGGVVMDFGAACD